MKNFINFLPPWVETNIQPAFYDKESGSVLQQTARMYAKVNQLVRCFNELSKEVQDYIKQFIDLRTFVEDYFENLDVQEEINNKLDEMAEDGTLQEIITTYIQSNVTWTFETVADMKEATNLIKGSYARTLGFYNVNDGGGSTYLISDTGTADESTIIAVGDLYAELQSESAMNLRQFGVKGDGTTDDSIFLQKALSFGSTRNLIANPSDTIKTSGNIYLYSNTIIDLNGSTILGGTFLSNLASVTTNGYTGIHDITMQNGKFLGDTQFILFHAKDIKVDNILFEDTGLTGHLFDLGGVNGFTFSNCEVNGNKRPNENYGYMESVQIDWATEVGQPIWTSLGVAAAYDGIASKNITISNSYFHKKADDDYYLCPIGTHGLTSTDMPENVTIEGCKFEGWFKSAITFFKISNLKVENCEFYGKESQGSYDDGSHSAIDIANAGGDNDVQSSDGIYIRNNIIYSDTETHDKSFLRLLENKSDYLVKNIEVTNNTATCGNKNFIILANVDSIRIDNNLVNSCDKFVHKNTGKTVNQIIASDNVVKAFTSFILSTNTDTSPYYTCNIISKNNIITMSNKVFDTSEFNVKATFDTNKTYSGSESEQKVILDSMSNALGALNNDNIGIKQVINKFKVQATFGVSGAFERLRYNVYDRLTSTVIAEGNAFNKLTNDYQVINLPPVYIEDDTLRLYGGTETCRYRINVYVNTTNGVTFNKDISSVQLCNW